MPGVFISYRREDSAAYAGRLFDVLSTEFGQENTFMDVDDIKGGDNFVTVIDRTWSDRSVPPTTSLKYCTIPMPIAYFPP